MIGNGFYDLVKQELETKGYEVFDKIKGKGPKHAKKPDYIARKDNKLIIGEIKSPEEPPTSGSWRQIQKSDSIRFAVVRVIVKKLECLKKIEPNVGGHIIIILGQLPDYKDCIGSTYDIPLNYGNFNILYGYSTPIKQAENVRKAFDLCKTTVSDIVIGKCSVTFIYDIGNVIKVLNSLCKNLASNLQ